MTSLRPLSLSGTQITNAGVVELRKALLNCKISRSWLPTLLPYPAARVKPEDLAG